MNKHKNISKVEIKDFKGTFKKLLKYCKPFLIPIVIAIVLSIFASICSIIGPNKLQDLTNLITEGLFGQINMIKVKNNSA